MSKSLCDLKKTLKKDLGIFISLIQDPTHVCSKCGRAANSKKSLCKPVRLPASLSVSDA